MIPCLISANKVTETIRTTKIEVTRQTIDYQSILDEFEDSELKTENSLTTFVGSKTIILSELDGIDLVSNVDLKEDKIDVKYKFSYDIDTNIVKISAELQDELGKIYIDEIFGAAFINEYGEIDAVMNIDGEGILLSEMRNNGLIANCGWFTNIVKKVVKVAVVSVAVGVAATVGVVAGAALVAAASAAAPAVIAVSTGCMTMSAAMTGIGASVSAAITASAGTALSVGIAAAAATAGVGIGMAIGKTIAEERDDALTKTGIDTETKENDKKIVLFPMIPETFLPRGLIMKMYEGTSNGRFIKWFDVAGNMIFEWDEDLKNGSHYHIMTHDGIHYLPNTPVPEPYASLYF